MGYLFLQADPGLVDLIKDIIQEIRKPEDKIRSLPGLLDRKSIYGIQRIE